MQPSKLLLFLILFFVSCAKEYSFEQGDKYFMTCTIDGTPTSFVEPFGGHYTDPDYGILNLLGPTDVNATSYFDISVYNKNISLLNPATFKKLEAGEYTDMDSDYILWSAFLVGQTPYTIAYAAGTEFSKLAELEGVKIDTHIKLTVTEIKNRTVSGFFSGDYFEKGDPKGKVIRIRDGKFYLPMK